MMIQTQNEHKVVEERLRNREGDTSQHLLLLIH